MASRNRTFLFIQYRNSFGHSQRRRRQQAAAPENEGLIEQSTEAGEVVIELSHLPPRWVDLADDINERMEGIQQTIKRLDALHKKHLLPGFDDRTSEEHEIDRVTQTITSQFQSCGELIRSIGQHQAHGQEEVVGRNLQSSLATRLQEASSGFRRSQAAYLQRMSEHKDVNSDVFAQDREEERAAARRFDMTLTDEQLMMMESNDAAISEREAELANIHGSIVELAQIFGQMQDMVIDQGTMLDRIDYNVENTVVNVGAAADELEKADKHHRNSVANKCIVAMGVVVAILFIILIIKWL